MNIQPTSLLLSREGEHALKAFLSSPKDVTRGMPARYLNHEPQSAAYRRFRAALLVSEILEPGLAQFLEKVRRCLPDSEEEWAAIEQDARTDYALATAVAERLASGGGPSVMA